MENLLIQRWPSWMLHPYGFDIHKCYNQSTSNEKTSEVFKHTPMTKASEVHKRTPMTN
jgi:hypothetical protein